MAHYTTIDSATFETFLRDKGFERTVSQNEVVYVLSYKGGSNLKVKVYTTITTGEATARACAADAIRCVVVWDNGTKSFGVGKFPKVLRTTSQAAVHERVSERIELALARCAEWLKEQDAKPKKYSPFDRTA